MSDFAEIKIHGLRDLTKAVKSLDPEAAKQIKVVLNEAADVVARVARPRVPSITGAARSSIVVRSTARESRIRVGGPKAPYYPWLDFGGKTGRGKAVHRTFIKGGRYLYPAYGDQMENIQRLLAKRLQLIVTNSGLDVDP